MDSPRKKEDAMAERIYVLADLSEEQLRMVREGEQTLDPAVTILAFKPAESRVADLNGSQVECLQGLEQKLGLTLVAYRKT